MKLTLNKLRASFVSQYSMVSPIVVAEFVSRNITEKGYTKVVKLEYEDENFLFLIHPEDYNHFLTTQDVYLPIAAASSKSDLPEEILEIFKIETGDYLYPADFYFDDTCR